MPKTRDARLGRLSAERTGTGSAKARERGTLKARAAVCAIVRDGLVRAGLDPARAPALRLGEAAALRLADLGDTPKSRSANAEPSAADDQALAGIFTAKIDDLANRYRDGQEPDVANASLAELFAWCLARRTRLGDPGPG